MILGLVVSFLGTGPLAGAVEAAWDCTFGSSLGFDEASFTGNSVSSSFRFEVVSGFGGRECVRCDDVEVELVVFGWDEDVGGTFNS